MSKTIRSMPAEALALFVVAFLAIQPVRAATPGTPIRVVIIGLVHDHALGLLSAMPHNASVQLVGIAEPDKALAERYAQRFHLDPKLFSTDTATMLDQTHPDAALVYTSIVDHRKAIEAAASRGIPSMVEKPLATNVEDALAIRKVAREHHVQVLTNYETTWYASNAAAWQDVTEGKLGDIRRVVVHDGHEGPKKSASAPNSSPG